MSEVKTPLRRHCLGIVQAVRGSTSAVNGTCSAARADVETRVVLKLDRACLAEPCGRERTVVGTGRVSARWLTLRIDSLWAGPAGECVVCACGLE